MARNQIELDVGISFGAALLLSVLIVAPVSAQAAAQSASASGDITPTQWLTVAALILAALVGSGGVLVTWVNNRFKANEQIRTAQIQAVQSTHEDELTKTQNVERLAESISQMATVLSQTMQGSIEERQALREERTALAAAYQRDREKSNEVLVRQAENGEREANILSTLENKTQAAEGRTAAVSQLVKHIDEVVQPVNDNLTEMNANLETQIKRLDTMNEQLKQVATTEQMEAKIAPIARDMAQMADDLRAIKERILTVSDAPAAPTVEPTNGEAPRDTTLPDGEAQHGD